MRLFIRTAVIWCVATGLAACDKAPKETAKADIDLATALTSKFDLVCDLRSKWVMPPDPDGKGSTSAHLRVDLASKRWCESVCDETQEVVAADGALIILKNDRDEEVKSHDWIKVNRESGQYTASQGMGDSSVSYEGQCRAISFSGFPPRKF